MREAYSATALASLEWSDLGERAVDRVAASGLCNPLGLAFWKAKYCNESSAYLEAKAGLIKLYKEHYSREEHSIVIKVIEQCLHEYLADQCRECRGAREMVLDDLKVTCPVCEGSGVKRYSDEDRARTMQLSYGLTKRLAHKIRWVLAEIATMDRDVNSVLGGQLER